jgi:hypothetical protein
VFSVSRDKGRRHAGCARRTLSAFCTVSSKQPSQGAPVSADTRRTASASSSRWPAGRHAPHACTVVWLCSRPGEAVVAPCGAGPQPGSSGIQNIWAGVRCPQPYQQTEQQTRVRWLTLTHRRTVILSVSASLTLVQRVEGAGQVHATRPGRIHHHPLPAELHTPVGDEKHYFLASRTTS